MVLAGGVGNFADQVRYGGYVVDLLKVGIGPLRTGIFNVADGHPRRGAGAVRWQDTGARHGRVRVWGGSRPAAARAAIRGQARSDRARAVYVVSQRSGC